MRQILTAITMAAAATFASAQQNVFHAPESLQSPVVNADGSVTFNLYAPAAREVTVNGDWEADGGRCVMANDGQGLWTATTAALPGDMYTYRFSIDGLATIDPANPYCCRDVANVFSIFFTPGEQSNLYQVHAVPHGTVSAVYYHSDTTNTDRRLMVYTPAGYEDSDRRYPVLYLLHGSGGDETAWLNLGCAARILDNLIARGQAEPMIVVMPNSVMPTTAAAGESVDNLDFRPRLTNQIPGAYKNGLFETAFPEIVTFIDTHFRTRTDRHSRAVAGLSMGGFHSLFIAANYPEMFDYVGLFSAGVNFDSVDMTLPAYDDLDTKLAAQARAGVAVYYMACGTDDFLYPFNRQLQGRLAAAGLQPIWQDSPRGHLWSNWRRYLLAFAPQLFK